MRDRARIERGRYICAIGNHIVTSKEIRVDHIDPVVDPKKGFIDWNTYIDRMFCNIDNLQIVCKECHKKKTKEERASK